MPSSFASFGNLSIFYWQRVSAVWSLGLRPDISGVLACIIKAAKTKWVGISLFIYEWLKFFHGSLVSALG
jgi:hypothetical protein